jgi:hypothetical protein
MGKTPFPFPCLHILFCPITNILTCVNLTCSHMGICVDKWMSFRVLSRGKKIVSVAKNFSTNAIDSQHPTV